MSQLSVLKVLCKSYQLKDALSYSQGMDFSRSDVFVESAPTLLFLYEELDKVAELEAVYSRLAEIASTQGLSQDTNQPRWLSDVYFLLGRNDFRTQKLGHAVERFQMAEARAMDPGQRVRACMGMASVQLALGHFADAEQSLRVAGQSIEEHFNLVDMNTQLSFLLWDVNLKLAQGQFLTAWKTLQKAEVLAKEDRNFYFLVQTKVSGMEIYLQQGRPDAALKLIEEAVKLLPGNLIGKTERRIVELYKSLPKPETRQGFGLVQSEGRMILTLPNGKTVDFQRQRQLVRLLISLSENPRRVKSKEDICRLLWNKSYHPFDDDNRIFSAIRRLRALLGESDRPKFVLQMDDGYILNPEYAFTNYDFVIQKTEKTEEAIEDFNEPGERDTHVDGIL